MNDRLAELTGETPSWAQEVVDGSGDVEMGGTKKQNNGDDTEDFEWGNDDSNNNANGEAPDAQPEHMKQFFDDVEAIKSDISTVTQATE